MEAIGRFVLDILPAPRTDLSRRRRLLRVVALLVLFPLLLVGSFFLSLFVIALFAAFSG